MTTHFDKGFGRPACRFSRFGGGGFKTSVNKNDVDCSRCAKSQGFTPKAKAGPSNPGGTCQACFRVQRVIDGKTVALHGYERPGMGHIVGNCFGSRHQPFEKDSSITAKHLDFTQTFRVQMKARLDRLVANQVQELAFNLETNERNPDYRPSEAGSKRFIHKVVDVQKGAAAVYAPAGTLRGHIPAFEDLRRRAIAEAERTISVLDKEIAFLVDKLNNWAVKELLP
jgi:hypothetical protein